MGSNCHESKTEDQEFTQGTFIMGKLVLPQGGLFAICADDIALPRQLLHGDATSLELESHQTSRMLNTSLCMPLKFSSNQQNAESFFVCAL